MHGISTQIGNAPDKAASASPCRRWVLPPDEGQPSKDMHGVPRLVQRVLWARGIRDEAAMRTFCEPRLSQLHNPSLMPDLDRAAARILECARAAQPIVIYGDYDVDGVSAAAILHHVLHMIAPGAPVGTYIPHRLDEGYGMHADAVRQLARDGARLIVSVDCGVTAQGPALAAREAGVDLIITDHHTPPARAQDLPCAYAVVHPRRPRQEHEAGEPEYPFGDLCGAGVAFKLAWRLATMAHGSERVPDTVRALLLDMLALASLGTVADVVPLVGENRVIARFGLSRLRGTQIEGLRALIEESGLAGDDVDAEQVGFVLGPRLNACGRMGHAREALELLTTARGGRAKDIARQLTHLNEDRRTTERRIADEAAAMAEQAGMTGGARRAIVLANEGWHRGVVGIVCSRLVGLFHRPTLLLQREGERCMGSGRSIEGFNLHHALSLCAPMLEKFGGHDMAAGLEVRADRLEEFSSAFIQTVNGLLPESMLTPALRIDCEAPLGEIDRAAAEGLAALGPFGRGNPHPVVVVRGLRVSRCEPMGKKGAHLSLFVRDASTPGSRELRVVAWGWGGRARELPNGSVIDAALKPKLSRWAGMVRVEGELVDAAAREG